VIVQSQRMLSIEGIPKIAVRGLVMPKNTREKYWYGRAEAFRAMAEQTNDLESRDIAFNIATDLERLGMAAGKLEWGATPARSCRSSAQNVRNE
jgi:hypothetical protein